MKRIYLIVLLFGLLAGDIAAQGFGIRGGFLQNKEKYRIGSHSRASTSNSDGLRKYQKYPNGFMNGMDLGLFYEYDIPGAKGFGFGLGVDYQFATDHDKLRTGSGTYVVTNDTTRTQHAVGIPVYLSYRLRIAKEAAFLLQTGPKFNYGFVNKVHTKQTYDDASMAAKNLDITYNRYAACSTDEDRNANVWPGVAAINTSEKRYLDGHVKPFNTQWMVTAGVQYQRLALRFTYAWGLQNLFTTRRASNNSVSYRLYDRVDDWTVSLSYYLTQQKKK